MTFDEQYHPCRLGVHVLALDEDAEHGPHVTVVNFPCASVDDAHWAFHAMRELANDDDSDEMMVDLISDWDIVDTFCMRRQMLERITGLMAPKEPTPCPPRVKPVRAVKAWAVVNARAPRVIPDYIRHSKAAAEELRRELTFRVSSPLAIIRVTITPEPTS